MNLKQNQCHGIYVNNIIFAYLYLIALKLKIFLLLYIDDDGIFYLVIMVRLYLSGTMINLEFRTY